MHEAIHRHFLVDSPDAEVMATLQSTQAAINKLWKEAHLPKFIQFGKDGQGEHSHALNGPAFKAVWRHPTLLVETIKLMEPVYELLETKRLVPTLEAEAVGVGADRGPEAAKKKRGKAPAKTSAPKKKKERGVAFDNVGEEEVEGEGESHESPKCQSQA